ncbi:ATP-binding cassette domain-containing protein [Methylosinus sp. H3A]|uniref:ATP-binding cassette domain-containing protein n=1 Tax=Methylosinus sp. H3A TaxID=2785786 RepID=UPI0018C328C6|nr:ATP-binding cassette domain-containing protein [Methylosinus sp. H3A]MBG0809957.1 ATP-binding cassette domain-containing protein [Methylosinus sp. H3A]
MTIVQTAVDARLAPGVSVRARNLDKSFGAKRVLSGLDLDVPAGQFLAIVGRSGCGKSTLLRLVAGLDEKTRGGVSFGEHSASHAREIVRVMFQEPRLLPWARVLANVEVGLGERRGGAAGREQALEALRSVGLEDRARDWPSTLSGGQKQRVAFARALVSRPRLLAFDEPLGALDALTRVEMQRLLETAWLRDGFTALLVTHDVAEAVALADRIVIIENGAISRDIAVDLPRPRRRGAVEVAELEEQILDYLLGEAAGR